MDNLFSKMLEKQKQLESELGNSVSQYGAQVTSQNVVANTAAGNLNLNQGPVNHKQDNMRLVENQEGKKGTMNPEFVSMKAALYFKNCSDCEFTVTVLV